MPRSIPNYLTIDPVTGAVGADFTGHIAAQGLDFKTGLGVVNAIRWLRANGSESAIIYDDSSGGVDSMVIRADAAAGEYAQIGMGAVDGTATAGFNVKADNAGLSFAQVSAGQTQNNVVLQDDGGSDFARPATNMNGVSGSIGGGVNFWSPYTFNITKPARGGMLIIAQGSGYVTGVSTVDYRLLFDGAQIAQSSMLFNTGFDHRALPLLVGHTNFLVAAGNHTIQFSNPLSPLTVDANDFCAAAWIG